MKSVTASLAIVFLMFTLDCVEAQKYDGPTREVTIGSGGKKGIYYKAAKGICKAVNRRKKEHGIKCNAVSTRGSIYNIDHIRSGEFDAGIAQSNWQYHAHHGTSRFETQEPYQQLRSVFSVHPEAINMVALKDSGVTSIEQIKGKRVNIGNPGSGTRRIWGVLAEIFSWQKEDFTLLAEMNFQDGRKALCDRKVDVIFFLVAVHIKLTDQIVRKCSGRLVEISDSRVDEFVTSNPYYCKAVIPGGLYKNNPVDINTFGVGATFVTSSATDADIIYWITKSVFEDFDEFKRGHPAFKYLNKADMVKDSLTAPLHDGAEKYYRESGFIQ